MPHGPTLIRCTIRPLECLVWLLIGCGLTFWAITEIIRSTAMGPAAKVYVRLILILLFGLMTLVVGLRELVRPSANLEATSDGILVHQGRWLRGKLFVPWNRIIQMRYLTGADQDLRIRRSGIGVNLRSAIALRLQIDRDWPPPGSLRPPAWAEIKDEIFLDANFGEPGGLRLFHQLEKIRARFSGNTAPDH